MCVRHNRGGHSANEGKNTWTRFGLSTWMEAVVLIEVLENGPFSCTCTTQPTQSVIKRCSGEQQLPCMTAFPLASMHTPIKNMPTTPHKRADGRPSPPGNMHKIPHPAMPPEPFASTPVKGTLDPKQLAPTPFTCLHHHTTELRA